MTRALLLALFLIATVGGSAIARPAETIYHNANIYTVDADRPRAEAMAVRGGRIARIGSMAEVRAAAADDAELIDLGGAAVIPGLIDAHGHVAGLGSFALGRLDLSRAASFAQVVEAVRARALKAQPGEWILGGRWDHESWPGRLLPTHDALSEAAPNNPVWLRRVDGHAALANEAAMRLAGIEIETSSPPGGEILRDSEGQPTGVFVDNAMRIVEAHITGADHTSADLILAAQQMMVSAGLTGVHDAGVSPAEVDVYLALEREGRLKVRVHALLSSYYAPRFFVERGVIRGERFGARAAKAYMDGAMGSRGAWLLEPYADRPADDSGLAYTGLAVSEPRVIQDLAEHALEFGYQLCTHAIGDRANREVLDAYERALRANPVRDHRLRVEHAQLLHPGEIPRFALLGVIASMQPTHCTSDMRWVEQRVGPERAQGAYAWASLLRAGAVIAAGSDFPVESHEPFPGLYAAITRQNDRGEPAGGWFSGQRMTREEALRAFTIDSAFAAFREDDLGSLTPGKWADFVVIDRDPMTCPEERIPGTQVLMTVIAGEVVYRR